MLTDKEKNKFFDLKNLLFFNSLFEEDHTQVIEEFSTLLYGTKPIYIEKPIKVYDSYITTTSIHKIKKITHLFCVDNQYQLKQKDLKSLIEYNVNEKLTQKEEHQFCHISMVEVLPKDVYGSKFKNENINILVINVYIIETLKSVNTSEEQEELTFDVFLYDQLKLTTTYSKQSINQYLNQDYNNDNIKPKQIDKNTSRIVCNISNPA